MRQLWQHSSSVPNPRVQAEAHAARKEEAHQWGTLRRRLQEEDLPMMMLLSWVLPPYSNSL